MNRRSPWCQAPGAAHCHQCMGVGCGDIPERLAVEIEEVASKENKKLGLSWRAHTRVECA